MPTTLTAPDRLNLLLPWLNGTYDEDYFEGRNPEPVAVHTDFPAIRRAIAEFLQSFDGSAAAAHLEVIDDPTPAHVKRLGVQRGDPTDDELGELEATLRILLTQGLGDGLMGNVSDLSIPLKSLRLSVRHAGRRKLERRRGNRTIVGGRVAQRGYREPGAYVLQVQGPTTELVPFLVTHLLTAPDMLAVKRCQRPGCDHLVVTAFSARGRPRQFCSESCRIRNAEQLEQQRKRRKQQ